MLTETERGWDGGERGRQEGGRGKRIGRRRRRWPEAASRPVKVRPLTGSWILSTWFFQSLTPFPSGARFGRWGGSLWLEKSDGGPVVLRRWHWHWLRSGESEPGMWSSRCGGNRFIGLVFCPLSPAPDRQSNKRWPIKDGKGLVHQVLGGRLTHKCMWLNPPRRCYITTGDLISVTSPTGQREKKNCSKFNETIRLSL